MPVRKGLEGFWTHFTAANSVLPIGAVVTSFAAAPPDLVWMNVLLFQGRYEQPREYGLFLTDGLRWHEYKLGEHGLPTGLVQPYMATDSHGRLWFDTVLPSRDCVLGRFDGRTTWIAGSSLNSLPFAPGGIIDLHVDRADRVWVSVLGRGVYILADEQWNHVTDNAEEGPCDQVLVANVGEDQQGSLWLACTDSKETRFLSKHSDRWEFVCSCPVRFRGSLTDIAAAYERHFAIDRKGNVWFGGSQINLMRWNGYSWKQLGRQDCPLFPTGISGLLIDEFDNVWVGAAGGGYAVFDGLQWNVWGAIRPDSSSAPIPSQGPRPEIYGQDPEYVIVTGSVIMDGKGRKWLESPQGGVVMFSPFQ